MIGSEGLQPVYQGLASVKRLSAIGLGLPWPMIALSVYVFDHFMTAWYQDPFILGILLVFLVGQLLAVRQYIKVRRGATKVGHLLDGFSQQTASAHTTVETWVDWLRNQPTGHLRDLLLRSLQVSMNGDGSGVQSVLDSAGNRRSARESKMIGFLVSLNRTTLKLGFLGTLIGLLMTFPPMKEAILALRHSDGELKFVTDIAKAIDGDHYAIYTTLLATGLSIFIEIITIQLIERIMGVFEQCNAYVDEWNIVELQPRVFAWREAKKQHDGFEESTLRLAQSLSALHKQMATNIEAVATAVGQTTRRLEEALTIQESLGKRVDRLLEFERDYRRFLDSKSASIAPPGSMP